MYAPHTHPVRARRCRSLVALLLATAVITPVVVRNHDVADALPADGVRPASLPQAGAVQVQESGQVGYHDRRTSPRSDGFGVIQMDPVGISDNGRVTGFYQEADEQPPGICVRAQCPLRTS